MPKSLAAVLIMAVSTYACAEWVQISKGEKVAHYIDPASVKRESNLSSVWVLTDLPKPDEDGIKSVPYLIEIDCGEARTRTIRYVAHAGNMAQARVIAQSRLNGGWKNIVPQSVGEKQMKIACAM